MENRVIQTGLVQDDNSGSVFDYFLAFAVTRLTLVRDY